MRLFSLLAGPVALTAAWLAACSSSDDSPGGIGQAGSGGSGASSGRAGQGGSASGTSGASGKAGAGPAGAAGASGQGGSAGLSGASGQSGEAGEAGGPPVKGVCPSGTPSGACTDEGLSCPDTGCPTAACTGGTWTAVTYAPRVCGAACDPGAAADLCTTQCTDSGGKTVGCSCVPAKMFDCPDLPACPVCAPKDPSTCDPTGVSTVPFRAASFVGQGFSAYSGATVVGSGASMTSCQPGTGQTTIAATGGFSLSVEGWGFTQVGIRIDTGSQQGLWYGMAPATDASKSLSPSDFTWSASGGAGGSAGTGGASGKAGAGGAAGTAGKGGAGGSL